MHKLALSSILAASLLACGGSNNNGGGGGGGGGAGGGGGGGGGSGSCTASASYSPDFTGAPDATLYDDGSGDQEIYWQADLNNDPEPDEIVLDFYSGYGQFGSGIATGTFTIGGSANSDETDYADCGLCSLIGTNVGSDGTETDDYFWDSGTVMLTSISGTFAGSLQNLHYRQVDYDSNGDQSDDPSGCTSTIPSATFSVTLDIGSDSGSDGFVNTTASNGRPLRIRMHR